MTVVNPCLNTAISIVPTLIENLVTFKGFPILSKDKYNFNDTVSFARTLSTDANDFCGDKILTFTINSTATTILSGLNSEPISFNGGDNYSDYGVGLATVKATMADYPSI